jgi:2-oxoglutarate ferredoxin oxidoreductase subunit beta
MPAIATGANAANKSLAYIGISGDGDSLSIGLGQMCHAIRRNLNMLYVIENNGVYGLTKGQFSASTDVGSKSKRGEPNQQRPIDPVLLGLSLRIASSLAAFRATRRSSFRFSRQPSATTGSRSHHLCITFSDHRLTKTSTRASTDSSRPDRLRPHGEDHHRLPRDHQSAAMHHNSQVRFTNAEDYDPTDREAVQTYVQTCQAKGEIPPACSISTNLERRTRYQHDVDVPPELSCGSSSQAAHARAVPARISLI